MQCNGISKELIFKWRVAQSIRGKIREWPCDHRRLYNSLISDTTALSYPCIIQQLDVRHYCTVIPMYCTTAWCQTLLHCPTLVQLPTLPACPSQVRCQAKGDWELVNEDGSSYTWRQCQVAWEASSSHSQPVAAAQEENDSHIRRMHTDDDDDDEHIAHALLLKHKLPSLTSMHSC
jgi:hypothetical protein